ncbi:hypothetical protein [Hymenobacter antarcticus]|uniref:hypothetical protein n=1 Tax=Hymenobacter antarcticus TaxID=486270 RepID=UPI0031E5EC7F
MSSAQLETIEAAYPLDYYRPAWPLRVGIFLFTWLGLGLGGGSFSFLFLNSSPFIAGAIFCLLSFGALELMIKEQRFYHCGADNALLYSGLSAAIVLVFYAFNKTGAHYTDFSLGNQALALPLLLVLALLVVAVLRYADALVTVAAFATLLLLVVIVSAQSSIGLALLPFLVMSTAAGSLALYRALARRMAGTALADYYASCLLVLKVLALAVFYLGGNYLVVREGNAELHHLPTSEQVPFAVVFYFFTAGIPFLYIVLGLRRADRPTLLMGLLALAFSLFTLRHYRSLLPPEIAAVLAGAVLTMAAGALLRALRPARFGLTSLPDDEPRHFNLENLIQAQTAHAPGAPAAGSFEFGGGQTGGGGATGQF